MITQTLEVATPISINFSTTFSGLCGGLAEGLFLAYLYQESKDNNGDWIAKTYKQWQEKYHFTRREVDAGRKKLKELGILEERKEDGSNKTVSYRIDINKVENLLPELTELLGFKDIQDNEVKQSEPLLYIPLKTSKITPVPELRVIEIQWLDDEIPVVEHIPLSNGKAKLKIPVSKNPSVDLNKVVHNLSSSTSVENKEVIDPRGWEAQPNYNPQYKSPAQRMEERFKAVDLPKWRFGTGRNCYKPDFMEYLKTIYLPKTPHYEGKEVMKGDVMAWLSLREREESGLSQIEAIYENFFEYSKTPTANAAKVAEEVKLPSWVKPNEVWVVEQYKELIACEFNLERFRYTKSQDEINIWEQWISKVYPTIWATILEKKKEFSSRHNLVRVA